jgi:methionyl-tRNA synthetase
MRGIGVFGTDVMETGIPADVWRFYIFYNRPDKADALFTG